MKPPRVRLAFWENKIPHWGVCYRPDGCTPENQPHRGKWLEKKKRAWPPAKMEERVLKEEGGGCEREGREELMPTAQQRPPPPPRAERSTGKELRSRGPRGVQVQGDCQCLHFNSRTTPSEYLYFHLKQQPHPHISIYIPNIKSEAMHKPWPLSHTYQDHVEAKGKRRVEVRLMDSHGNAFCL